jgi:hypothetical protein
MSTSLSKSASFGKKCCRPLECVNTCRMVMCSLPLQPRCKRTTILSEFGIETQNQCFAANVYVHVPNSGQRSLTRASSARSPLPTHTCRVELRSALVKLKPHISESLRIALRSTVPIRPALTFAQHRPSRYTQTCECR